MSQPTPAHLPPQPELPAPARSHGLVAAFAEPDTVREALEDLHVAGVPAGVVTVLGRGEPPQGGVPTGETLAELAAELAPLPRDAAIGAVAGAYAGLWGSLLLLAVPGFGPAVVAGGSALVLAEGLASLAAGASLGSAIGGILHERHEAHHREMWERVVADGGWLLIVHGTEGEHAKAAEVLARHFPDHLDHFLA